MSGQLKEEEKRSKKMCLFICRNICQKRLWQSLRSQSKWFWPWKIGGWSHLVVRAGVPFVSSIIAPIATDWSTLGIFEARSRGQKTDQHHGWMYGEDGTNQQIIHFYPRIFEETAKTPLTLRHLNQNRGLNPMGSAFITERCHIFIYDLGHWSVQCSENSHVI